MVSRQLRTVEVDADRLDPVAQLLAPLAHLRPTPRSHSLFFVLSTFPGGHREEFAGRTPLDDTPGGCKTIKAVDLAWYGSRGLKLSNIEFRLLRSVKEDADRLHPVAQLFAPLAHLRSDRIAR